MHVCVNTCVCNGGSPVSCLQPCVHSQQSVCGEYDGKVHEYSLPAYSAETLGNQNSVTYFGFIYVCRLSVCLIVIYASLHNVIFVCTGFSGFLPVSVVERERLFSDQGV